MSAPAVETAPAVKTFFEHQHLARRNTKVMVLLFLLAVVAVVIAVDLVLAGAYVASFWDTPGPGGRQLGLVQKIRLVPPQLFLWGAIGTALVIFTVSMFNVSKLASGGVAVAEMIGARRVSPDTKDALERRLLNVVEEMAIAAGVRVPAVYVMDTELGINAFAAGWDVSGAVVTVTRGTLEKLTRDELQGVVAHEFSHILNGDMRLNIRMIGVLAGIVFIGAIGHFLMRNARETNDGRAAAAVLLVGLALFIVGYVGLFFARLIKSAVSREREFLADASSVQFTRNPDGIAGALDQMRVAPAGALIGSRYAEDMSHMFFGQGIVVRLGSMFDTHPPLDERIRRANPRFHLLDYRKRRAAVLPDVPGDISSKEKPKTGNAAGRRTSDLGTAWGRSAGESAQLVGTLDSGKIDYAARLIAALPQGLQPLIRDSQGAGAAMIALLLAPKDEVMQQQIDALRAAGLAALGERAAGCAPLTRSLAPAFHLPVIDLALSAVKATPQAAQQELIRGLEAVIHADRRVSLHEFVVLTLVRDQLTPKARPGAAPTRKLADLQGEAALLLAILANAGTRADATGERQKAVAAAYAAGAKVLGFAETPPDAGILTLDAAAMALAALKGLAPMQKAVLVKALFATVTADGSIKVIEAELMRLVGAVLDCPLPPLLEDATSFS